MRGIFDSRGAHELLVFGRKLVVHGVARHKGCCAKRHRHLFIRAVVVDECLFATPWNTNGEKRRDDGRSQPIQSGVDVPSVEPSEIQVLLGRDGGSVERSVMRMSQLEILQALVLIHEAIADDLDLRLVRNSLEIRMQD